MPVICCEMTKASFMFNLEHNYLLTLKQYIWAP